MKLKALIIFIFLCLLSCKPKTPTVDERVIEVIQKRLGVYENFSPNSSLSKTYKMDELDLIEITMELEEVFNIAIPDKVFFTDEVDNKGLKVSKDLTTQDFITIINGLKNK